MMLDDAARQYLGVPYRHQGRNPDVGIDCVGLLSLALRDIEHPAAACDVTNYGRDPAFGLLEKHLRDAFGPPVTEWQAGDVASCQFFGAVRHVAILGQNANGWTLIHTTHMTKRAVEHSLAAKWIKRVREVYRP